jgi:hypothetical protein
MVLFGNRKVMVFDKADISVGDFDPTVPGCYRNVVSFPFDVRPKKALYAEFESDNPVDVVLANSNGSVAAKHMGVTVYSMGPVVTKDNKDMGLILGVFPGDKAKVSARVWMDKL